MWQIAIKINIVDYLVFLPIFSDFPFLYSSAIELLPNFRAVRHQAGIHGHPVYNPTDRG
jgi:hypothetical protein